MENFESLDALVAPKQEKDQLLFDLSLFKSSDEVPHWRVGAGRGRQSDGWTALLFYHIGLVSYFSRSLKLENC